MVQFDRPIYNVDELKATTGYKETRSGLLRKVREDKTINQKTIVPPRPSGRLGADGQASTSSNLSEHFAHTLGVYRADIMKQNPSTVLREFQAKLEAEGSSTGLITPAYAKSQPQTILDYSSELPEGDQLLLGSSKCPRCGLKLCACGYLKREQAVKGPQEKRQKT
eukprot:GHVR01128016.1.p1 GENE.GHVR01128016.1~~GHVR01128016.1.p1  ORF type:complete len:166 (+),score=34.62 GHVR01128016.1:259-756(+)